MVQPTPITDVIRAAIAAHNEGDAGALSAHVDGQTGRAGADSGTQDLLGCAPGRACHALRPMPLRAGEIELAVRAIYPVDERCAVCELTTPDGTELVGVYAVDGGQISAACHYFSDIDLLAKVGTLTCGLRRGVDPSASELVINARHTGIGPAEAALHAEGPRASATLAESLRELRLRHRHDRLQLVILALDERLGTLGASHRAIPQPLLAAIQGFQKELVSVRAVLRTLGRSSTARPAQDQSGASP